MLSSLRSDKNLTPILSRPSYFNKHAGCTVLVVATGPSLKEYSREIDELIKKYNAVTLGANNVSEFLHPSYHCFTNRKRFTAFAGTIDTTISQVLLGPYLSKSLIKRHYRGSFETLMYVNDHERQFDIQNGIIQASCRTVGVLLIGVAIVMGAKQILVAGMDGYKNLLAEGNSLHHYDDGSLIERNAMEEKLLSSELFNARFLGEIAEYLLVKGKESFKIVTPTVYKSHYKGIDEFL